MTLIRSVRQNIERKDAELFKSVIAKASAGLRVIGVTGTKGKTSTALFIYRLLHSSGQRVATFNSDGTVIDEHVGPPIQSVFDLLAAIRKCRDCFVEIVVIEFASRALANDMHLPFDIRCGLVTNIGSDHIHDHGSVEEYVSAKARLLTAIRVPGHAILNEEIADSAICDAIPGEVQVHLYSTEMGTGTGVIRPLQVNVNNDRISVCLELDGPREFELSMRAPHQVRNVIPAILAANAFGADPSDLQIIARQLLAPAGRFEIIQEPSTTDPGIIVDYAHTPESMSVVLSDIRVVFPGRRVVTLFGCGGGTYRGKRGKMGQIAALMSDDVILTTDNPREESPQAIIADIKSGVPSSELGRIRVVLDRKEAIYDALVCAGNGGIVVLLGKGPETVQQFANSAEPFRDAEAALRAMEECKRSPDFSVGTG